MGAAGQVAVKINVEEKDRAMEVADVTKMAAFPERSPQVTEATRKSPRAMYRRFSLGNSDLWELEDEQELTHE